MPSRGGSSIKVKHGAAAKTSTVLVPLSICTEHGLPQDLPFVLLLLHPLNRLHDLRTVGPVAFV